MRITSILNRQHNGFMFHRHWHVAKNRKVRDTGVASSLKLKGVEVTDPQQYMKYEHEKYVVNTLLVVLVHHIN